MSPVKVSTAGCLKCWAEAHSAEQGHNELRPALPQGRVGVHHVEDAQQSKNFTFKCHRDGTDIYAVNAITFHPVHGTFVTAGSDGAYNFWDKVPACCGIQSGLRWADSSSVVPLTSFKRRAVVTGQRAMCAAALISWRPAYLHLPVRISSGLKGYASQLTTAYIVAPGLQAAAQGDAEEQPAHHGDRVQPRRHHLCILRQLRLEPGPRGAQPRDRQELHPAALALRE